VLIGRALRDLMPPGLLTKAWPSESFYVVEPDSELLTTEAMLSAAQGCYRGVVRWVVTGAQQSTRINILLQPLLQLVNPPHCIKVC